MKSKINVDWAAVIIALIIFGVHSLVFYLLVHHWGYNQGFTYLLFMILGYQFNIQQLIARVREQGSP